MTTILRGAGLAARIPDTLGTLIYRDIDVTVADAESVAILGRSGAGKSTLLATLGLLQPPHAGEVWIKGQEVSRLSDSRRAHLRNREIGFVFQDYALIPQLSVKGNLEVPLSYGRASRPRELASRISECLELVGMNGTERRNPSSLSGGEQQRVAIARALAGRPSIILADEPTGALDTDTGDAIVDVLRAATSHAGCCLVIVTHDPLIADRMDRSYRLTGRSLEPVLGAGS